MRTCDQTRQRTCAPDDGLSRRGLLRAAAPLAAGLAAVPALAIGAQAAPLSANDARLIALAEAYEATEAACNAHTAAHRDQPTDESEKAFADLCSRFGPIEEELAATPADTLTGILAKARAAQVATARAFDDCPFTLSIADDLWRLFGGAAA